MSQKVQTSPGRVGAPLWDHFVFYLQIIWKNQQSIEVQLGFMQKVANIGLTRMNGLTNIGG